MSESSAVVVVCAFLGLWLLAEKRITRMQREIDLIVKGDLETLKLKRKLDGYPEDD